MTQVCVAVLDDEAMIRVYARENATQRHGTATAVVGSVAAAIRYLAKAILGGENVPSKIFDGRGTQAKLSETLTSEKGLGEPTITAFLKGVPGINPGVVRQQLAILGVGMSQEFMRRVLKRVVLTREGFSGILENLDVAILGGEEKSAS